MFLWFYTHLGGTSASAGLTVRAHLHRKKDRPSMNIRKDDETKAVSFVLVKQKVSSEEVASKLIDFHWQIAQIVERNEEQKRQNLLDQMQEALQNMTASEKRMVRLLLGTIMDQV